MTQYTLFICSLCRFSATEKNREGTSGGQHLIDQLQAGFAQTDLESAIQIQPVRCMAQCSQPCNVTLAAPDKLTFVMSDLSPTEAAPALVEFCRQYTEQPDGKVPYRERSPAIHEAISFILPPLPAGS